MAHGKKYGAGGPVRSIPEALDGKILTGRCVAANPNFDGNLNGTGSLPTRDPEPFIEGVTIESPSTNTGTIEILGDGQPSGQGYRLHPGRAVSLHINLLSRINLRIPVNGEDVSYIAIAEAT